MVLALTDEQRQLSEAMAGFTARYAPVAKLRDGLEKPGPGLPAFWDSLVDQGWHAVHLPEDKGGQGGGLTEACCVLDAAGYGLLPGPLLQTVVAGAVAMIADPAPAAAALLKDISGGATAVVVSPDAGTARATETAEGWRLDGELGPVISLPDAGHILVLADVGSASTWFVLDPDTSGLNVLRETPTDLTRSVGRLQLDGCMVGRGAALPGVDAEHVQALVLATAAAEAAGVARWCVDSVVAYLKVREQFGRPIGAFQALQHKAASLYIAGELAAAAAWDAARAASQSPGQRSTAVAGAAVVAISRLPELVVDTLTMFGAVGYTWEHDLHLYWRRAVALAAAVGPADRWRRRLGAPDAESRDFTIDLGDAESEFRSSVAEILDCAAQLRNDAPSRQVQQAHSAMLIGPQRTALADRGLVAPHLPAPWGLAATPIQQLIIAEEFEKRPTVVRPTMGIADWILPTILHGGTTEQKERFAGPTLRGELAWCQLFSEPGAGSDLASLSTRATKVDGGWLIEGQKVWTSLAHQADFGALLARSDPDSPKHKGISYFLIDMTSPGIEIRPLRQASGDSDFNEVFLDDVFVPDDLLVGEPGAGWSLAIATMGSERSAMTGYIKLDRERELRGLADDPAVDKDALSLALGEIRARTNAISALGVRDTLSRLAGHGPGPAASIGKVAATLMLRETASLTLELAGRTALLGDSDAVRQTLLMPAELIGGGTIEVQLNIIATMILGLPRK